MALGDEDAGEVAEGRRVEDKAERQERHGGERDGQPAGCAVAGLERLRILH